MVDVARARKLSERIKVLVAEALERAVKDPDLGFVTITDVKVTPDLQPANLRRRATTSWLVQPEGLSMRTRPEDI